MLLLLSHGAEVNIKDDVSKYKNITYLRQLFFWCDYLPEDSLTPLHYSVEKNSKECLAQLLAYGAEVNVRDCVSNIVSYINW